MNRDLPIELCGSHMKPNDLVKCQKGRLIDSPSSLTAASNTPAAEAE